MRPLSRFVALAALCLAACGAPGGAPGPNGNPQPLGTPDQHRPAPATCPDNDPVPAKPCTTDADCNSGVPIGQAFCAKTAAGSVCHYDRCHSDADCGASGVCSCKGSTRGYAGSSIGNQCVPSNCRSDADCGVGGFCSPTVSESCGSFYGVQGYYCHTAKDTCARDADCTDGMRAGYCAWQKETGAWACGYGFCAG